MDRRTYLISVFEDTLRRIDESLVLRQAQEQSIVAQTMIPETTALLSPEPIYNVPAEVLVTHNRSFEAAAQYGEQKVCVLNFASASNPGNNIYK